MGGGAWWSLLLVTALLLLLVVAVWTLSASMTVVVAIAEVAVVTIGVRERHARHVRARAGVIMCVCVGVCMCVNACAWPPLPPVLATLTTLPSAMLRAPPSTPTPSWLAARIALAARAGSRGGPTVDGRRNDVSRAAVPIGNEPARNCVRDRAIKSYTTATCTTRKNVLITNP